MKIGVGRGGLIVVLSFWTALSLLLVWSGLQASSRIHDAYQAMASAVWQPAAVVQFDGISERLVVPSWRQLDDGKIWAHVWKQHGLATDFEPELTEITEVNIGKWVEDKRIHPQVLVQLQKFMVAAEAANQPTIITSAYRSYASQIAVSNEMTLQNGQLYADEFVAEPGHSEHQLGLAVDFSSFSTACQANFANCRLSDATAKWLAAHAHEYGFILRYPEGKQNITGVAPEGWHFRYVGLELAGFMRRHDLTLEEIMLRLNQERQS